MDGQRTNDKSISYSDLDIKVIHFTCNEMQLYCRSSIPEGGLIFTFIGDMNSPASSGRALQFQELDTPTGARPVPGRKMEDGKYGKYSSAFPTGFRCEAVQTVVDTRRIWRISSSATEGPADVLDSTSRSQTERNAVDMHVCTAAVETL